MAQIKFPFGGNGKINTGSIIVGVIVMIVILVVLMSLAKLTIKLLSLIALPLLLITAIIDHKILINYGKWIVNLTKRNTLLGIGAGLLSIVFYPVVSAILFGRAFFGWRLKKARNEQQESMEEPQSRIGEYIDYEELKEPRRPIKQEREPKKGNEYDQLFGND